MKEKKWALLFIIIYISLFVLIGVTVYVVDPYFHYHKPIAGMSYSVEKEAYVNDGISKNFDYNAIITGTSMTLGFKVEEANKIFEKDFVRLSFPGEGFRKINENLENAIESNPKLDFVIRSIDTLWFISDENWLGYDEYPEYLYDDNIFNDVKYLYNVDVLCEDVIPQIVRTFNHIEAWKFDDYVSIGKQKTEETARSNYEREQKGNKYWGEEEKRQAFEILEKNLNRNVLSVIEKNPNIMFYLFFPPYSILWWDANNQVGPNRIEIAIEMEKFAIEKILQYENVHLYSFFNDYEMICDLRNYTDKIHYTHNVNSKILNCMKNGKYEITKDNYKQYLTEITEFYCNYDYDALFD